MKLHYVILAFFLMIPQFGFTQEANFYVSNRYQEHFAAEKTTGRSEVAFFAVSINPKDSCLQVKQYRRINENRYIDPEFVSTELYCWDEHLALYSAACQRGPSEGLLKHQHTEGENWIKLGQDSIQLRRCGWVRTVNTFILADSLTYLQK